MNTATTSALSQTGTFNHAALGSGREFRARDFVDDEPILGLQREGGYIWGTLRDEDGVLHSTMRRIAATPPEVRADGRQSLGGKHILMSADPDKGGMALRKEARYAVDSAAISATLTDDETATISSATAADGQPMRLVLNKQNFSYKETGVLEASGQIVVPPLQWYLPGRDASLLYITQTFLVEADILGKFARGFLFWEEAWMLPGGRLYMDKDPLHDAEYLTWYSWANHYDDGSCEVGHHLFGNDDFHVGVRAHSDGTTYSGRQMDAVITRNADGYWHDGIDYQIDGEAWRCDPDPRGRMVGLGTIPNPQQEGRIYRVNDTRKPDLWMAWGETVPARGNVRTR